MNRTIDNPHTADNRAYDYSGFPITERSEYRIIADLIPVGSRVLDLGCGNGSLMARLRDERKAIVQGIEISNTGIVAARKKRLKVLQGRIDEPLRFKDNSFDYAVCNVTIQMVMYPEILLREMRRIAPRQIVSIPNFGYWRNRIALLMRGNMPPKTLFGYTWYSTGHIHQGSLNDFRTLVREIGGLRIVRIVDGTGAGFPATILRWAAPNLFHLVPVFLLEKTP